MHDHERIRPKDPQPSTAGEACMPSPSACYRESGRSVLQERINRVRQKAADMETLFGMLPMVLTPEQDQALWNLALELGVR